MAAYIAAADEVDADSFATYVDSLKLEKQLPNIGGLGLIIDVPDAELDAFVEQMRDEGRTDFDVKLRTDSEMHYILKYVEPKATNSGAIGLDLSFTQDRVEVLEQAKATRSPQMTPPVSLVVNDKRLPGFVLIAPVFDPDEINSEDQFKGWVSAGFVSDRLISGLTSSHGSNYDLSVYDGTSVENGTQVFSSLQEGSEIGDHSATFQLNRFGRTWTLLFSSTPAFDRSFVSYQPLLILFSGLAFTAFLVTVLRNFHLKSTALREIARLRGQQVAEREEENRSIIQNDVTSVLLLDALDNIRFANQAALECFGFTSGEITGMKFANLATLLAEPAETHNAIGVRKDGRKLELDLQRNDWMNSEGAASTTVIIRDLTEQNQAQRDLKSNKALYDMALQGADIGVFDVDLTTGTSEVSETWCRIMGYTDGCNGMDTQRSFLSRIHPDDVEILNKADTDCIEGRTQRSIAEYRLKTRDGGWCWMRSDAVVVERDETGKATRMIGTQTDVTALRRDRNALEASEGLFRQVLASAPIGMALMDDQGRFIGLNDAFCELSGRSETDLLENARLADLIPYEHRKPIYAAITRMIKDDASSVYTGEHRIICAGKVERWGLLNISWSFDRNLGTNFFIAQVIDITEQKRLDQIKNEFVSTVSHELRTPLTSIKGALGLLTASASANLSSANGRLVQIASANAERLTDIVNDILDLEKIASGKITFDFGDCDLGTIIEDAGREMMPFAVTHESTLQLDVPDEPIGVFADPRRTKQVLANLISNACKYSDPSSDVVIKAERIDDQAIVFIQNVGPGVPEAFRSRIFDAFSQADSSDTRAKGGTGLGLNITRQIVLRHGGQIGFESIADGITVFWFTIPLAAQQKTKHTAPSRPQNRPTGMQSVLHVEDDGDFAEVISGALEKVAHVTHAKSLGAAKVAINSCSLDVVILDWSLPDGDAETLLNLIATRQPHARIIALSADAERRHDPRIYASMVKSRTDMASLISAVECHAAIAS
ncbi:CHASE domain-containing protein [Sulfitobacter noctilucae]|uniref:CHASE domain-containing protein n=1 Tax=Sulfitobacter noctilucae TaxID=1342302 RepID=UPI001F4D0B19|nr:CHASE domain-containing protein [Sulfitobacter noctilucae]